MIDPSALPFRLATPQPDGWFIRCPTCDETFLVEIENGIVEMEFQPAPENRFVLCLACDAPIEICAVKVTRMEP